ncbi:uncharacterized protein MELLADRAFT_58414 [Melampsora larici-populina 98AG31]|uniref:Secreted protein n=1 Tax=Melampsora larici-populina (strain 98AG31 / pathotype 3-4-7) TaxID=747676 RepID=F4R3F7_MELLP|nr:uncharacterized protein MELLADRAFT_58414 [Melampsora larici-populina 98AG31]EGG13176.1 hypothetical protein MELLADRAFT_58414 [Melampsora larici-populina 98AG31]
MIPNQHLIAALLMALFSHITCVSTDNCRELRTPLSIEEVNSSNNIYIGPRCPITAHQQEIASGDPHWPATLSLGRQNKADTQETSDHPLQTEAFKGKKRISSGELKKASIVHPTESYKQSHKHRKSIDQIEDVNPNQGIRMHSDGNWNHFASNFPLDLFNTGKQKTPKKPCISGIVCKDDNTPATSGIEGLKILSASSSSDTTNVQQKDGKKGSRYQKYTFINNGKTALLPNKKVQKIGERWHVIPDIQHIVTHLKIQGFQIAINAGLHFKGEVMHPWFHELQKTMQNRLSYVPEFPKESIDISLTIYRAYRYLTMQFLASLHMIHASRPDDLVQLTHDGWNFILKFLGSWTQVGWKELQIEEIDTSRCWEIYTPSQILIYLMKMAPKSRVSMCIVWSVFNSWYQVSEYGNKMKVQNLQDFITKIHYQLAKSDVFTKWEVEPSDISTILQLGSSISQKRAEIINRNRPSKQELCRENTVMKSNHCKRVVSLSKEVGKNILSAQSKEGLSLEFVTAHFEQMKQKISQQPQHWQGDFDSLMKRVLVDIFPGFLGMIQILCPIETEYSKKNPAVINGFQYLMELLEDWGEDALERASQIKFKCAKTLDLYDDVSGVLLAYLMKLCSGRGKEVASNIFWLLWKGWDRWDGSKSVPKLKLQKQQDLIGSIENSLQLTTQG